MRKLLILSLCLLMSATVTACKSEEVKNVESAISTIGEMDLDKKDMLLEIEDLYESLPEKEKSKVDNYDTLESAWTSYDDILKDFEDEVKFCATAVISVFNTIEDSLDLYVENVVFVNVDGINYSLVLLTNNDPKTGIEGEGMYIVTNDGILVQGKTLGVRDNETGFTVFANLEGKFSPEFIDNYNSDITVDVDSVLILAQRYFETEDYDLIDAGALARATAVEPPSNLYESEEDALTVVENWVTILDLLGEHNNSPTPWDFDGLDELYYKTMAICEDTRRINLSGLSEELEQLENLATYNITMMTYESMQMQESFKRLDTAAMKEHSRNGQEYYDDFIVYMNQFGDQYKLYDR